MSEVHAALDAVRRYWRDLTGRLVVETPDPALNLMANGWLAYQAISGRLFGRSAYYQTGGAYGFRDQLQDSLTWLLLGHPEKTLEQIRLHARHQYQDGIVLHWWHPLAETGQRSEYSDDLLWLPFVTLYYLRETGDFACLDTDIPFYDGGSASLRDHCLRAFEVALGRRSPRGLPLILKGDWNDGMNAVGVEGRGESVWMAHFLHYLLCAWAALPVCDTAMADRFRREADTLREARQSLCLGRRVVLARHDRRRGVDRFAPVRAKDASSSTRKHGPSSAGLPTRRARVRRWLRRATSFTPTTAPCFCPRLTRSLIPASVI